MNRRTFIRFPWLILPVVILLLFAGCSDYADTEVDFNAYYTNYDDADKISGEFADIVIRFPDQKKFVFSRASSYLPFLIHGDKKAYVDEIVPRKGDGEGLRFDKTNIYSYVRIIRSSEEEVLVHWRYIPDFSNPEFSGVVHEYYTVKSDGSVIRIIQPGRTNLEEFNDAGNQFIETFKLTKSGITKKLLKEPELTNKDLLSIEGSPAISREGLVKPLMRWGFDEGLESRSVKNRDITMEEVNRIPCTIYGNISLWKSGVSGTALAFDGYHSKVTLDNAQAPGEPASFTLDAWVALGAYPWKEGAVMDITEGTGGVYFGISDLGNLIFRICGENKNHTLSSKKEINLGEWTYIAASYNLEQNTATLYINGEEAARLSLNGDQPKLISGDIVIGLNKQPEKTTQHVSQDYPPEIRTPEGNQAMLYGIEGLIDEPGIYMGALTEQEIRKIYKRFSQDKQLLSSPELEPRILPGQVDGEPANKFGATYTNLHYHDLWDNLWRSSPFADIVVRFDQLPCNVVYWRGVNYGAGWVTENNIWMSDQSSEIMTHFGCAEHMADKQNRYSHVRILENTDARVVIHWRYASAGITYQFENWRTWTDEYHTIYPDGMAVRYVDYHDKETGWQDVQFFAQPGTTPEDQINLQALTVANLKGETHTLDWTDGVPENKLKDASISIVNFKSDNKVVVIYPDGTEIGTWGEQERATDETHFAGPWNHWPVSQMPNDGRYALRSDRVTHSALGGGEPESMAIYGFTNKDISTLIPLAKFWNYPPTLEILAGAKNANFDKSQKAYIMAATEGEVSVLIDASKKAPVQNPCFVIKNWGTKSADISMNGKKLSPGKELKLGYVPIEGGYNLVVWIDVESSAPLEISISNTI